MLNVSFESIVVNNETLFREVRQYIQEIAPEKIKIVKLYQGAEPIFDKYGIEKQIKTLFGKTVSIKSGAYLIIEHTEALHVIDVNSGNRSKSDTNQEMNALEVNLAAADEIARQLRLRDMGGIIVIDFIDMHSNENKQLLYEKMKELMARDRTKNHILPLSKFGLMQITRQRVRPEMNIDTLEKCPSCMGTGKVEPTVLFTDTILSNLIQLQGKYKLKHITLEVHPFVASYLNAGYFSSIRSQWQKKLNCRLKVVPIMSVHLLEYKVFDKDGNEIEALV
jgi:ribonuclease G